MANNNNTKVLNVPNLRFPEFTGEWSETTLSEISNLVKERINTSSLKDNYVSTENLISNFGGVQTSISIPSDMNVIRFKEKDVLISNIRPYLRKVWFADKAGGCSTDVFVFRAKGIEPSFLYNTIANDRFINYVMSGAKGVKMPRGDKQQMLKYQLFVPSIDEQEKISRLLRLLDERIATQNKIIDKLQSLIKGISQQLLTKNKDWIIYKLMDIALIKSGYSGTQVNVKTPYKVSRIETISRHCINMKRIGYVQEISEDYKLNIGDILFSNINSVEYIGNTAYIDKEYGLYHGMNLLRIIPNANIVLPRFLHLLFCTGKAINHFQTICNKAVSQASINQTALGKSQFSIPPMPIQQQICSIFEIIEMKLRTEQFLLNTFQRQKGYLLQQMFI